MKYHIFLIITTILIIELCNIYICKIASFGNKNITIHKNYKYIFLIKPLIFLIIIFTKLPLPLYYILFYIVSHKLLLSRKSSTNNHFIPNMAVISFCILHLITVSTISLVKNTSPDIIFANMTYKLISILIASILDFILWYSMNKIKEHIYIITQNQIEFSLFLKFIWFTLGYILFDSIQITFAPPSSLTSYFILGSNILLILQLIIFINHIYSIEKNIYLEKEHNRLKMIKQEQLLKVNLLKKKANIDELTSAYNRKFAFEKIQHYIDNNLLFSLIYIDLDKLKTINDTYGHLAGDNYIINFSSIVIENLGIDDIFARIGGDEFIVIIPKSNENTTKEFIEKISKIMDNTISFSYGIVEVSSENKMTVEEIINIADIRMYTNKQNNHKRNNN
ncbi:diguanylate cyclase domain protein [Clostridioides difficile CD149]|uniref:GGDEF domain-containing protein n=4 Tax=Clostridioides difficile TaxID=1496 RepID=UPI00038CBEB0|nr:GGDEF domain-containing protein [Clostridioides difficile]EQF06357.1 diguanylate cyclase domain protein [Clostridioides difficile CD131]EQF64144.1 diguanylate cyclase domain protein [Clostridioides difficile CD200]EQG38155.1 diguanylate cyclase domain protein [Clostridioides difficile DA00129]EQJ13903.1 diguanylate cyclase domain protein [Clostridioides difficile P8]EQK15454.1 diguanylate cyclase domain protein [Clostridioides difficile P69]EQK78335.1 diguanylate cyclase domain protein [Cl